MAWESSNLLRTGLQITSNGRVAKGNYVRNPTDCWTTTAASLPIVSVVVRLCRVCVDGAIPLGHHSATLSAESLSVTSCGDDVSAGCSCTCVLATAVADQPPL